WSAISHFLLVFVQSILINYLVNHFRLNRENTYFPAVFYVFTIGAVFPAFQLTAPLVGVTFLLIMLVDLFGAYKSKNAAGRVFNMGFWVAVASLFYLPWMVFLVFGLLGLVVLNVLDGKTLVILLIGFCVPYFLLWTYFYVYDQGGLLWSEHFGDNLSLFDLTNLGNLDFYYRIGLLGIVMILGLLNWNHFLFRTKIQVQKYFNLVFYFLVCGVISFFLQNGVGTEHLIIICVPISVFLGLSILRIKTRPIAEFLHLIMLLLLIGIQFREQLVQLLINSSSLYIGALDKIKRHEIWSSHLPRF
ncbi:MAG: DUF6427 family protein, partial [Bacteroidota bacterium]